MTPEYISVLASRNKWKRVLPPAQVQITLPAGSSIVRNDVESVGNGDRNVGLLPEHSSIITPESRRVQLANAKVLQVQSEHESEVAAIRARARGLLELAEQIVPASAQQFQFYAKGVESAGKLLLEAIALERKMHGLG